MNRLPAIPALALLGIALVAPPVGAIDGSLDLTLQGTGTFNGLVPTLAGAVALTFDPEGRPVMGYTRLWSGTDRDLQIAVVYDQGPAGGCNVSIDLGGTNQDHLLSLARTSDRVYLVGKAAGPAINPKDQLVIARLNPTSCALDSQFDGDGKLIIPYANPLVGRALSVEPDGRLRAAVEMRTSVGGPARLLSLGLHANGSGDGTFGTQIVSFSPAYAATEFVPTAMARQPDGKVVVVGAVHLTDGDVDVGVVRYFRRRLRTLRDRRLVDTLSDARAGGRKEGRRTRPAQAGQCGGRQSRGTVRSRHDAHPRATARPVRDRPSTRGRRHGRGLPRPRHPARSVGGDQAPERPKGATSLAFLSMAPPSPASSPTDPGSCSSTLAGSCGARPCDSHTLPSSRPRSCCSSSRRLAGAPSASPRMARSTPSPTPSTPPQPR